jgi:hypothetical protein
MYSNGIAIASKQSRRQASSLSTVVGIAAYVGLTGQHSLTYNHMQLLATSRTCPLDRTPLQHASIERYRPNYTVISMVEAARDPTRVFQLQPAQLQVDMSPAAFLGRGGSGTVYRGTLAVAAQLYVQLG